VIMRLAGEGVSIKEIVRRSGHSRKLVRQVIRGERTDVFRVRQSSLDAMALSSGDACRPKAFAVPARGRRVGNPPTAGRTHSAHTSMTQLRGASPGSQAATGHSF
jgi:hypothetical protein